MDSMVDENKNGKTDLSVEFLSLNCPSGMPPHLMKLKVGAFIVQRTLYPEEGTRLVVIHHVMST